MFSDVTIIMLEQKHGGKGRIFKISDIFLVCSDKNLL